VEALQRLDGYSKFLWLELIGFDNQQEDMGVGEYIDSLGFVPDGVSIFMWGPDFVHLHEGLAVDAAFPADIGAYLASSYSDKKYTGPPWTKYQLKAVIDGLHSYGVSVLFSIFPNSLGNRFHHEWISDHPEVAITAVAEWQRGHPIINPLRRLGDGSYYEDFFVRKVAEVVADYGFDGYHMVDGYNHGWLQLCHGDYSDDMIGQFIENGDVGLPDGVLAPCGRDPDKVTARAAWIWQNKRREWIAFHADRWERFFRKVVTAMHADGKQVACNTCWTRGPLEAMYRYGIDYRRIAATGVDRFIVETCSAGGEMLNSVCRARYSVPFFHVIMATALLTRAYAPDARILFNNCTQDITEGWSILRHAPAFLEREVYAYANLYHHDPAGRPTRSFDGLQVCLASGMTADEWRWLSGKWQVGFAGNPESVDGLALVWSDQALHKELDYYVETRGNITSNILYHLMAQGVPVYSTVGIDSLNSLRKPLLVINPHLFPESEMSRIMAYTGGPVVMVGPESGGGQEPNPMVCRVHGTGVRSELRIEEEAAGNMPADLAAIKEPPTFFDEQYFREVSEDFWDTCVSVIAAVVDTEVKVMPEGYVDSPWVKVETLRKPDGSLRVLVGNDGFQYSDCKLGTEHSIANVRSVSDPHGRPVILLKRADGSDFLLRIPPKGMGIADVQFEPT
jgi:hypothetical protein